MVTLFKSISESKWFQNSITVVILLAGVLVGISTYHEFYEEHKTLLEALDKIILGIFIIEIVVKILAEGKNLGNILNTVGIYLIWRFVNNEKLSYFVRADVAAALDPSAEKDIRLM